MCTSAQLGADAFGGGRFGRGGFDFGGRGQPPGGARRFLVIDEATLQTMADLTGGEYYRAEDADQLVDVFLDLPARIELQEEEQEVSFAFGALGALLAAFAFGLSLLWNRYP